MHRIGWIVAVALIVGVVLVARAEAQTGTLRTTHTAVVMELPRGDAVVVGSVEAGKVMEYLDRQGDWFLVTPPADAPGAWLRGWIQLRFVQVTSGAAPSAASAATASRGGWHVRGFGQAAGTWFSASNSFETIVGSSLGFVYGGGGQLVFPNGSYVEGGVTRFNKTGSRALVSGNEIFILDIPHVVTVMPIEFTWGYRWGTMSKPSPYAGLGLGWHELREESSGLQDDPNASKGHIGYHFLAGAEFPLARWLWLAGEIKWAGVPGLIGETGVSAVYDENDLGGTTLSLKILIGR